MPDFTIGFTVASSKLPIEGQPIQLVSPIVDDRPAKTYIAERLAKEEEAKDKDIEESKK